MAIPDYLLNKLFPRLNINKINVEGDSKNIDLSIEVETISIYKQNIKNEINSGFYVYSTDEDVLSKNNLQEEFENAVLNDSQEIIDFSYKEKVKEEILEEINKKYISKKFFLKIPNRHLNTRNLLIVYGSWRQDPITGQYAFSRAQAEILFENGKLKSESYIYFLRSPRNEEDEIWTGEVVRSSDQLSFLTVETVPRELDRYLVKNYKVQDFRVREQIKKSITDYTELNNKIIGLKSRQTQREQRKKYFTDLYISQKNNIAISFGINFRDIVLENSLLGKDPSLSLDIQKELFTKSKILDLKIVKRRVKISSKNTNRLTSTRYAIDPFPGSTEIVVSSARDTDVSFESSEYLQENTNIVADMADKMRFFSCIDTSVHLNERSLYQYGIKVEIMDGSRKIILEDIEALEEIINKLELYYTDSLSYIYSGGENGNMYTEVEISELVDSYIFLLGKYYSLSDRVEIKNKIIAMLSPVNIDPSSIDNFSSLCRTLLSTLENMVGEKINYDLHIMHSNSSRMNTKNTFTVEHYFNNYIYDTSLIEMKRVEYLMGNSSTFFNQYKFSQINFGNRLEITKNSSGNPVLMELLPLSLSYEGAYVKKNFPQKRKFAKTEEQQKNFDKIIRNNLLNNVNIEVTKSYLKKVEEGQDSRREIEDDPYHQDIAEIYKYFSLTNVKNKEIDEVIDHYNNYEKDFLTRIQFLSNYSSFTGEETWLDISNLPKQEIQDNAGQIFCRLRPIMKDVRSTSWNISDNVRLLDTFFIISVDNLQDLKTAYSEKFQSTYSSARRKVDGTKKEASQESKIEKTLLDALEKDKNTRKKAQQASAKYVNLNKEEIKQKIEKNSKKIRQAIGNRIING